MWQKHVDIQTASNLSQAAWCRENQVNLHNFRYWKNRLEILEKEQGSPQQFIALKNITRINDSPIVLKVGHVSVEIHEGFNQLLLDDLLKVLVNHA